MPKFSQHEETAKEYNMGGQFWKPEKGENRIRILSEYEVYGFHWDNKTKKGGVCIGREQKCDWCASANKPSPKFLMWVLDRNDGEVKIAQVGYQVIKQLGEYAKGADWGFESVPSYDIVIKKTGEGLETEYFVQPTPDKKPLTNEEQQLAKENMKDLGAIVDKMKQKAGASPDTIQVDEQGEQVDDNPPPTEEAKRQQEEKSMDESVSKIPF